MPLETNLERDTKVVQVKFRLTLYYHIRTNKLLQINFKQLCLISSGFLTCTFTQTNWIILKLCFPGNLLFLLDALHVLIHVTQHRLIETIGPLQHQTLVWLLLALSLLFLVINRVGLGVSVAQQNRLCMCDAEFFWQSISTMPTTMWCSLSKGSFCNNIKYELTVTARQRPPWKSNERRKITPKMQIRRSK